MAKVSADRLYDLQDKLITYLTEELDGGESLSSGTLQAIRGVLKDNEITSGITESEPMQDLVGKLMKMHKEAVE